MSKPSQCCCGRLKRNERWVQGVLITDIDDIETVQINDTVHEPLGPDDNFCGPVKDHTIRELLKQLTAAKKSLLEIRDYTNREEYEFSHFEIVDRVAEDAIKKLDHVGPHPEIPSAF